MLSNRTIVAVKAILGMFGRAEILDLMLEAGAKRERVLAIPVVGNMRSPQYKSKAEILSEAFDRIFSDFETPAAERIILDLIRIMAGKRPALFATRATETNALRAALEQNGLALDTILVTPLEVHVADAMTPESELDDLLPIYRRKIFDHDLRLVLGESSRKSRPLSLLMIDLDNFKSVNDRCGHHVGDEVLVDCARVLNARIEGKGKAYRYGGEEIAILLPNFSILESEAVAETLRKSIEDSAVSSKQLKITVSIGVACFPDHSNDPESLKKRSDEALYQAKRLGKNLVRISGEPEKIVDIKRKVQRRQPHPGSLTDGEQEDHTLSNLSKNPATLMDAAQDFPKHLQVHERLAELESKAPRSLSEMERHSLVSGLTGHFVATYLPIHSEYDVIDGSSYASDFISVLQQGGWNADHVRDWDISKTQKYKDGIWIVGAKPDAKGNRIDVFLSKLLTDAGIAHETDLVPDWQPTLVIGKKKVKQ